MRTSVRGRDSVRHASAPPRRGPTDAALRATARRLDTLRHRPQARAKAIPLPARLTPEAERVRNFILAGIWELCDVMLSESGKPDSDLVFNAYWTLKTALGEAARAPDSERFQTETEPLLLRALADFGTLAAHRLEPRRRSPERR